MARSGGHVETDEPGDERRFDRAERPARPQVPGQPAAPGDEREPPRHEHRYAVRSARILARLLTERAE
jgi:hypothetical protein